MKRSLLALAAWLAVSLCAMAQEVTYGIYPAEARLVSWGTAKAETYNVAIRIDDPSLAGSQLTAISFPLNNEASTLKDGVAFITHQLKLTSGKAVPDVCSTEFTPAAEGWTEVVLPEPFTLDGEPFYAGFSITVGSATSDGDKSPLLMTLGGQRDGLYLGTSRTYRKWEDMNLSLSRTSPVVVTLVGDFDHESAAGICYLDDQRVKRGAVSQVKATIVNHGTTDIHSLDYTYSSANGDLQGSLELEKPISASRFGTRSTLKFDVPAQDALGLSEGTLTITGVNGKANEDLATSASHTIEALKVVPVKRPLLEEFTGTWCGWCPRGYIGLLLLNERHPDEFIGASYHQGDVMTVTENYPVYVFGYPAANIDRCHDTDAYKGDTNRDMGIEETWRNACLESTPANVYVQAQLNEDETQILVASQYEFAIDQEDTQYGVAYIVTADSLCGTGSIWAQHSYFPGVTDYGPEMDMFTQGPEYLHLVYDDVVIAQSGAGGATISGVVPAAVHEEDIFSHQYTFALEDMTSMLNGKSLVQNKRKLNVIALLYDRKDKKVVNCAKAHVATPEQGEGIRVITDNADRTIVSQYGIDGKPMPASAHGFSIVRLSDGSIRKVFKQ